MMKGLPFDKTPDGPIRYCLCPCGWQLTLRVLRTYNLEDDLCIRCKSRSITEKRASHCWFFSAPLFNTPTGNCFKFERQLMTLSSAVGNGNSFTNAISTFFFFTYYRELLLVIDFQLIKKIQQWASERCCCVCVDLKKVINHEHILNAAIASTPCHQVIVLGKKPPGAQATHNKAELTPEYR